MNHPEFLSNKSAQLQRAGELLISLSNNMDVFPEMKVALETADSVGFNTALEKLGIEGPISTEECIQIVQTFTIFVLEWEEKEVCWLKDTAITPFGIQEASQALATATSSDAFVEALKRLGLIVCEVERVPSVKASTHRITLTICRGPEPSPGPDLAKE